MASTFIKIEDYKAIIRDTQLMQIIQGNTQILEDNESTAISVIKDALFPRYDTTKIFGVLDDEPLRERNPTVVRWVLNIAIYYAYERIPDKMVPERVIKNYDDTMYVLDQIADGKRSIDLPQLTNAEGQLKTKFRWGSQTQRDY